MRADRLVQVKIGTMSGDVMRLMFRRQLPKAGDRITLRHAGPGSHGKRDMIVIVDRVGPDGRLFCERWGQGSGHSYNLDGHRKRPRRAPELLAAEHEADEK